MLTSIRGLAAATILSTSAFLATPALANDGGQALVDTTSADAAPQTEASIVPVTVAGNTIDIAALDSTPAVEAPAATSGPIMRTSQPVDEANLAGGSGLTVSGSVTLVTDYRFRGVSLSGGDPAIQGGITITHDSGLYIGTWSSSIAGGAAYGEQELDLFGGWSGGITDGFSLDVGLLYYVYPTNDTGFDVDYWEPYATVSTTLGPVDFSLGVNYAWDQSSLGNDNNFYVHGELGTSIPNTPISLSAHLGYTDGALAADFVSGLSTSRSSWDWSVGASATVLSKLEIGVSYIGVEAPAVKAAGLDNGFTNGTVVGTLGLSF
ncbi:TorF family putative porin [Tsuneonella mangrovi]|uniref:TorF family putative porin n=1 Tax=Tsuneonella mangrovi TaxID=1982042 RepID=UPI001F0ACE4E|nr:TorF family putative porin [Tsuneonella mangrovi]